MLKEFKEFALKGNMLDLAIGIMIGAAFGAVVNSLVTDLVTPLIALITGGIDFTSQFILLKAGKIPGPYPTLKAAKDAGAVTINYGNFINLTINFLIVALVLFFVVKAVNRMRNARTKEEAAAPPPEPPAEVTLLTEIRDLLKSRPA